MIREIDPFELEQLAADAITAGRGRQFAEAVVNGYRVRGLLGDLLASITDEEENSTDIHEFCNPHTTRANAPLRRMDGAMPSEDEMIAREIGDNPYDPGTGLARVFDRLQARQVADRQTRTFLELEKDFQQRRDGPGRRPRMGLAALPPAARGSPRVPGPGTVASGARPGAVPRAETRRR